MAGLRLGALASCFPDELVQQALPCFNFTGEDNINTYFMESLELCEISSRSQPEEKFSHPWSQLAGCVPEVACRCVGSYLLRARHVEQSLTALKTRLIADIPKLKNATLMAARWQVPLRSSRDSGISAWGAREMFWNKFSGFRPGARGGQGRPGPNDMGP